MHYSAMSMITVVVVVVPLPGVIAKVVLVLPGVEFQIPKSVPCLSTRLEFVVSFSLL